MEQTRILVVSPFALLREGVCALLSAHPHWQVVGEMPGWDAVQEQVSRTRPHVVVVDVPQEEAPMKRIPKALWKVMAGLLFAGLFMLVLGTSTGPQGLASPSDISVGTIEGRVVALATGKGIEQATVVTDPATASVTTDAEGKYQIENVPIGIYTVKASAVGYNAGSRKVSVTAGMTVTANFSLTAEEPFALARVRAVSWRTGDKDTYPEGKLRLTTHYALGGESLAHGENIIVTSGLPNVAVGSYVYLEGREKDAAEKKITAWKWEVVGPGESKVELENPASQTPRFRADKIGKYQVKVTVTNEKGQKSSSELVVYAETYVGAQTCIACHSGSVMPDTASEWQQTGHATKLIDTYSSYTPERDYCIACHTTGYDETDKAGGFDDLARQLGWDPSKASLTAWLLENKWTIEQITASPMGKLANVQCEACHGPGLIHEGVKYAKETAALFNPGVCSQCHPQEAQWRYSGHVNTGSKEMHMAEGLACVECHTGQGYVEIKIRGKKPVFPNMATAEEPATLAAPSQQPPVACVTCHDPHAFTEPFEGSSGMASYQLRVHGEVALPAGVTVGAAESATCVLCHANKRDVAYKADFIAGKKTRGVHSNTQADVFYGVGAFDYGQKFTNSPHTIVVKEGCIQCHMAPNYVLDAGPDGKKGTRDDVVTPSVGGHSFSTAGEWEGKRLENVENACAACHTDLTTFNRPAAGDYDGDGKVEGVQDEVKGLLEFLAKELPKDPETGDVLSYPIKPDNTTEAQRKALWNYWLVRNDGSLGIHNTRFVVDLLRLTYKELTGKEVGR